MKTLKNNKTALKKFGLKAMLLGSLSLGLVSCDLSDDGNGGVVMIPIVIDGTELMNDIQSNREEALQTFTIDASLGGTLIGEQGTNLVFAPNNFQLSDGSPVSGSVTVELLEVFGKGDMALQRVATNGKNDQGEVETLISGGEVFIRADQNGEPVFPAAPFQLFVPNDTFDPEMQLFSVTEDCDTLDCEVVWEEDEAELMQGEGMGPDGTYVVGYTGFRETFGWTNLDRWAGYAGPKTLIYVDVPEGYNATNCSVYVSYDGEPALALLDIYDEGEGLFTEHYGQMPIGQEVHFIFMSKQNGSYIYAIQGTTIGEDHIEVIGTTQTSTEAELFALIEALP